MYSMYSSRLSSPISYVYTSTPWWHHRLVDKRTLYHRLPPVDTFYNTARGAWRNHEPRSLSPLPTPGPISRTPFPIPCIVPCLAMMIPLPRQRVC
ncbi:hypothetical protein M440DRAFT_94654 [Trichoderma longibrachiatum ATCC 18648]|uniref:Uncharacterized protein n=1 Tax=Trichoderma longibrachiatum ATCC 18648 TaxID=983965 RepID=A0A2T4CJX0_TRILO|nr:hypothetical protein M440DRAFT_94654 [Trichoderma longibrachiatum ATCC 18648]